jgi:hypothetical protein
MSKTRKILATLTMVAVATTASASAISSAQAHPSGPPHLHAIPGPLIPGPGPIYTGPLFPGPLTPTPTPTPPAPPPHHKHKYGQAAALGVLGGVLIGSAIANANKNKPAPAPAAGLPTEHYLYCDKKYKTYKWQTNTFTGYDGLQHYCKSPYVY